MSTPSAAPRALLVYLGHTGAPPDGHPRHHVAPVDLAIAATYLERAGYRVQLWDTHLDPDRTIGEWMAHRALAEADLLLVKPLLGCERDARLLAQAAPRAVRLAMGPAVGSMARALLDEGTGGAPFDGVLVGEPEPTLAALLERGDLAMGNLPEHLTGLQRSPENPPERHPLVTALDELPPPAHHHLVGRGYQFRYPLDVPGRLEMGYVLTSRGCALGCVFCGASERESLGTKYRWRSASSVVDELAHLKSLGVNAVYFIDDFFGFSPRRIRELCEEMLRRDVVLPWCAQVRAHGLDLELLRLMRKAGCSSLCFGAETGSDRLLEVLHKGVTVQAIRAQTDRIREAGIQMVGYFMVGVPGETDAERAATYRLIEEMQPAVAQVHIFNVVPETPAADRYPERAFPDGTKFTGPVNLDPRVRELDRERRAFYRRYYFSPRYLGRTARTRWRYYLSNLPREAAFASRMVRYFLGAEA